MARVRDEDAPAGLRVLVDRLWPRGLTKERAAVDHWAKALTPSTELRRWYHAAKEQRHDEFAARYRAELDATDHSDDIKALVEAAQGRPIVMLSDVRDLDASHVPVLRQWLDEQD